MLIKSRFSDTRQINDSRDEETSQSGESIEDPLPAQINRSVVCLSNFNMSKVRYPGIV